MNKTFARGAAVKPKPVWDGKRAVRDGMVAVVYSGGYGAAWSAFADTREERDLRLFHPDLVGLVERFDEVIHEAERDRTPGAGGRAENFIRAKYEYIQEWARTWLGADAYEAEPGCRINLHVRWIPVGAEFVIHEYDGAECVRLKSQMDWITA